MDLEKALSISSSALDAERLRMNIIASNLANVNSTQTPEGGPYRRKDVIFESVKPEGSFNDILSQEINEVKVKAIMEDQREFKVVYDPQHPDADDKGYVRLPNVNIMEEMVNMMSATRSYEANVTAINSTKSMVMKALEIGR